MFSSVLTGFIMTSVLIASFRDRSATTGVYTRHIAKPEEMGPPLPLSQKQVWHSLPTYPLHEM